MGRGASVSKYYKSFSGTDTIAFLLFPGVDPITIGSLTTVSYSMFRNKVPVINLGRTNINGLTRGSRIYAGTMVFTLLNKHWLRELQDKVEYLKEYPTLKVDELPLFDIMILSANEYGSSVHMFVYGIDFTDEAQTVSVEDLFTENVFKFVAREISVFDNFIVTESDKNRSSYYAVKSGILKNYYVSEDPKLTATLIDEKEPMALSRVLYYIEESPMMGNDVAAIQQLLNNALDKDISITFKYDHYTDQAVREFQRLNNLIVNGTVDNQVYTKLLEYTKDGTGDTYLQVINKSGAYVYAAPNTDSNITQILPYMSQARVISKQEEDLTVFYQTENGWVSAYDVYNIRDNTNDFTYESLEYNSTGSQVTILQQALESIYENFAETYQLGIYDQPTEDYVKKFQREHDLEESGKTDYYTWQILMNFALDYNIKEYIKNHTNIQTAIVPGTYTIDVDELYKLRQIENTIENINEQQVKFSAISKYKDGSTKTESITRIQKGRNTYSANEFEDMFKDDPVKLTPTDVYYIIYPYDSIPCKWHFKVKE